MTFTPSKYQQAGFDWLKNGHGSAVLVAVAGSGKTTELSR
jgi:superfamily II DNA or RNA helicase